MACHEASNPGPDAESLSGMTLTLTKRRVAVFLALLLGALIIVGLLARQALTGLAVSAVLQLAGASEVSFTIAEASPWRVTIEDIAFQVRAQQVSAKRVSFTRPHWWTPSLGTVRVEQARVPLAIDAAGVTLPIPGTERKAPASSGPSRVPFEEISVDGQLLVKIAALPEQALDVKVMAKPTNSARWDGRVQAGAPGLKIEGSAGFDLVTNELDFKVPVMEADLKAWQGFLQQLIPLPGGLWEVEGKVTGNTEGRLSGEGVAATARVLVREGRMRSPDGKISADGIDGQLEFTDLKNVVTRPGIMRIRELLVGQLRLQELDCEFAFQGSDQGAFSRVRLKTLGGSVSAEPFSYRFSRAELDAVVRVDGISIEEIMALTPDLPAKATGRVSGRFPIQIDDAGLRLGTGWLQLTPGFQAELQLKAGGLLTGGASPGSPSYAVLKKVETGLLKLKVTELRLDIRPPDAPAGRSAQLHVAGEPVDPEVKAPVILDLNVNGPLEKLINLGLDSRLSFGTKP